MTNFSQWFEAFERECDIAYGELRQPMQGGPDLLFHYTKADGLEGIISANQLWFSEVGLLNDTSESAFKHNAFRNEREWRLV
jgi:hypothetical protein